MIEKIKCKQNDCGNEIFIQFKVPIARLAIKLQVS